MKLEQPRGWIWADFSGVGDADSSSSDEGSSDEAGAQSEDELPGPEPADALTEHDGNTSDFENAHPGAAATPLPTNSHDTPVFAPRAQHHRHHQQQQRQHQHQLRPFTSPTDATPTQRPHQRPPLQPIRAEPPPRKTRKAKMPVLRAHLVQIKILENHQNGKDTHLRGLQIFAKDTEGGKEARRAPSPMKVNGGGVVMKSGRGGGGGLATGMGMRGLGRSEWDVEGSIR